jgi:hypothetical protein
MMCRGTEVSACRRVGVKTRLLAKKDCRLLVGKNIKAEV